MAFVKTQITSDTWTLVANNKTSLSAFNIGQFLIYLAFTSTNTPPVETVGMPLDVFSGTGTGLTKQTITNLSHVGSAAYVWARSAGAGGGTILVETN